MSWMWRCEQPKTSYVQRSPSFFSITISANICVGWWNMMHMTPIPFFTRVLTTNAAVDTQKPSCAHQLTATEVPYGGDVAFGHHSNRDNCLLTGTWSLDGGDHLKLKRNRTKLFHNSDAFELIVHALQSNTLTQIPSYKASSNEKTLADNRVDLPKTLSMIDDTEVLDKSPVDAITFDSDVHEIQGWRPLSQSRRSIHVVQCRCTMIASVEFQISATIYRA